MEGGETLLVLRFPHMEATGISIPELQFLVILLNLSALFGCEVGTLINSFEITLRKALSNSSIKVFDPTLRRDFTGNAYERN